MGIGASIFLFAVGAVLTWAVSVTARSAFAASIALILVPASSGTVTTTVEGRSATVSCVGLPQTGEMHISCTY